MRNDNDHSSAAFLALGAFAFGILAAFAAQYAVRRVAAERARRQPRRMDALMTSRRYEPRPSRRITADDPWEHYEEVLG